MKMKRRIFYNMLIISFVVFLLTAGGLVSVFYNTTTRNSMLSLRKDSEYILAGVNKDGLSYFEYVPTSNGQNIFVISPEGKIVYTNSQYVLDNAQEELEKDNTYSYVLEGNRKLEPLILPEVQQALEVGAGEAQRKSLSTNEKTLYYATALKDGNVLCLSSSIKGNFSSQQKIIPLFIFTGIAVVAISALLASWATKKIIMPIKKIDLENPTENSSYDELSPLLLKINKLRKEKKGQVNKLQESQREFDIVTKNLSEGLLVLNETGVVLSINDSAKSIFNLPEEEFINQNIVVLNRDWKLSQSVEKALQGKRNNFEWEVQGLKYYVMASPVKKAEKTTGVVLLLMEITSKQEAENIRREFSANVSHELKTPLTSISGYAEIIENGLAKQEDVILFAGRIHQEALGMIDLVEDIMKLSRMDEISSLPVKERVDLSEVASKTVDRLQDIAQKRHVNISFTGEPAYIQGSENVLQEIIYNLCENALKYNIPDGKVDVSVVARGQTAILTVLDTGVGIPEKEQERVFERFYRVDKSHSKKTGGTGLGLSIVKHGILYHDGTLQLKSTEGYGTTITVNFPLDDEAAK